MPPFPPWPAFRVGVGASSRIPKPTERKAMAHPKRRSSKARHRLRKTHQFLVAAPLSRCPRCGAEGLPHRVCENCGYYRNRKILLKEEF